MTWTFPIIVIVVVVIGWAWLSRFREDPPAPVDPDASRHAELQALRDLKAAEFAQRSHAARSRDPWGRHRS